MSRKFRAEQRRESGDNKAKKKKKTEEKEVKTRFNIYQLRKTSELPKWTRPLTVSV